MPEESKERTDLATAIRSLAAEEFSLSRHYEQVQYALLAASAGACGFVFSQRLAFPTASILFRWTATIGILLVLFPLALLILRYCLLSILTYHTARKHSLDASVLLREMDVSIPNPLKQSFSDPASIWLSKRHMSFVRYTAPAPVLFGVLGTLFAVEVTAALLVIWG